jgi:hypothetical protein
MNRHMIELRGRTVALGHGRTIVPVYEVLVEHSAGTRHWWVTVALQPVCVLVRTDSEGDGAEYREERIEVSSCAAANER